MNEPVAWRIRVNSGSDLTASEVVFGAFADALDKAQRVPGAVPSMNTSKGVLLATVSIEDGRQGAAAQVAVDVFYDALRAAGFDVDRPGWRLYLELEALFTDDD